MPTSDRHRRLLLELNADPAGPAALESALSKAGVWLDFGSASTVVTGSGYSSVVDRKGGSPAVQATDARRPVNGTSANGLAIATFTDDVLALPLSAGNNGTVRWGVACWIRPANVAGDKNFFMITSTAGGASANKIQCGFTGSQQRIIDTGVDGRRALSGTFTAADWQFMYIGVDCSLGTEAAKVIQARNTTFQTVSFTNGTAWPAALAAGVTGNMLIGAATTAGTNGLVGSIGPDVWFLTSHLTQAELTALAAFRQPT